MTIFEKIIQREIPADIVFEDAQCVAFRDIHPVAPVHILVVPKKPLTNVDGIGAEDANLVGHLFCVIPQIAAAAGLSNGYRVVTNNGPDAGQTVDHLHFHILGGRRLKDEV